MLTVVSTAAVLLFQGCATGAGSFKPDQVPVSEGGFFGHLKVTNNGEDVTTHCYANFTDSKWSRKRYISLDETGWVFSSAAPGETYFQGLVCTVGGLIKHNVFWKSEKYRFMIPPHGEMAYFGDVTIPLKSGSGVGILLAGALAGGAGAGIAAASSGTETQNASVVSHFDEAKAEYLKRFGSDSPAARMVDATMR